MNKLGRTLRHGHSVGYKISPTYSSWKAMRNRCNNPKAYRYERYGGRGITVCERWNIFENFLEDMGERPNGTTLGRLRENEGYSKENCAWQTWAEQGPLKCSTKWIELDGERVCMAEACRRLGIKPNTLIARLSKGWSMEKALRTPVSPRNKRKQLKN